MTKLTYTNDQQIINDAAQMLVESHLRWTDSGKTMPSEDRDNVCGQVVGAYLQDAIRNGLVCEDGDVTFWCEQAVAAFKEAAQLADRKWQEAMTLLGIED